MKGCFGCFKLIHTIISLITISVIGFIVLFPCGGLNYIKDFIYSRMHPLEESVQVQARNYGDFSKIPNDFKLTRVVHMLGASAVVAQNNKNNQKMLVINPGWLLNLSKSDVNANTIDFELRKLATKMNNQAVKLSSLEVGKKGTFKAFDQDIPYVKLKVSVTGNTNKNIEGIIGVIDVPNGKNKLVVSVNDVGKYQQNIAERYFKSVKLTSNL